VSSIQVLLVIWAVIVSINEVFKSCLVECTNRLGEISVDLGIFQVEHLRFEILKDPGEDRVLSDVLEASLSIGVKEEQIVEIRKSTIDPHLSIFQNRLLSSHTSFSN
jgi:hypothetical protein